VGIIQAPPGRLEAQIVGNGRRGQAIPRYIARRNVAAVLSQIDDTHVQHSGERMIFIPLRARTLALLLSSFLVSGLAYGAAAITSVLPAEYKAATLDNKKAAALVLRSSAPAVRIALPAPTDAERGLVKAQNTKFAKTQKETAKGTKGRPLAIGYGRNIPAASQRIALASLPWQTLADGTRAARLQIVSPDAAAVRVALQLSASDPDLSVRFSGNAPNAEVFGPIPANTIADDTIRFGMFWSPTLDGDVATIEFHADAGAEIAGVTLVVPRIAHHLIAGYALKSPDMKTVSDIGTSGACNIDVSCVTPQTTAFVNSTKSVAQILFTQEDGASYLCTGTLLNDSITSGTPYFFTANHCINSALAARTLNTFWFFDAVACGNHATIPAYVQQTAGATLLARSEDWDWALVRLNAAPPPGAFFSAWRSDTVTASTTVAVIHHPQGDLKKWAQGFSPGYQTYSDGSSFIQATYSQGTTEGGSSGAALLTLNGGGFYEVRGGLFGGLASCSDLSGVDVYSRFDNLLPLVRQYLTPGNNPSNTVVAVEFYNATLQHYFISTAALEINDLDTGVHVGWERTGFRFLAYETPVAGTSPVCRFYRAPAYGDSHFYSADPKECANTAAAHPVDWIYESPAVFYIPLPNTATGTCPTATRPVWRFFNKLTTNHRYTTDVAARDDMNGQPTVWIAEGYGPGPYYPIMCTPVGS
jgi:hypothetical protein